MQKAANADNTILFQLCYLFFFACFSMFSQFFHVLQFFAHIFYDIFSGTILCPCNFVFAFATLDAVDAIHSNFLQLCYFFWFCSRFCTFLLVLYVFALFCTFCKSLRLLRTHFCVLIFHTKKSLVLFF